MSESDDGELTADIVELTEGWSLCNDDMYRIANQLVSLAFANKYFGADSNRQNLLRVCEAFYQELCALGDQVELRPNFDYERVYQLLIKILNSSSDAQDSEDVLVEEDKSTLFAICPISRRPITHPVSQRFSHGDDSCDHVFDHASITDLIRSSKGTNVNCPVAG
ncbi:hypothetical protein X943_003604 [Babesia divergens]|uniref:SP-RING-type domain-containing protein n=1 Tax=Babesia divergens TaxID=32595 RepID=A0AAD9GL01_BABDI|nr:hypothetical protein X943_003604 [Babesia divergens]